MFKKIEIWILYLVILLGVIFSIGFSIFVGVLVRQELVGSTKFGWLSKTALSLAEIPINLKRAFDGVSLPDRFPSESGFSGTFNYQESYLLLSRYDGDLGEGIVELIDLNNFEVLHTWNPDIDAINNLVEQIDDFKYLKRDFNNSRHLLEHPQLTSDGGLLFNPIKKIDACSNLVFQNTTNQFHHSIELDSKENIWVASQIYPQSLPAEQVGRDTVADGGFKDDAIAKLSPDGTLVYEKSVAQIFIENDMEYLLNMIGSSHQFEVDPIHINDIHPAKSDSDYWKQGDLFISLGHQSMIILYRPSTQKIIWKLNKDIFHQHDVNILNGHEISIFNNNRKYFYPNYDVVDGNNEVLIYNFKTNEISTYLQDSIVEHDVRTITQGRSRILPNGDLFIEETDYARTLYFNSNGSLRWSHVNRASDGKLYRVGWSRILYSPNDIRNVNKLLKLKGACND
jgi:hypothetical protein